MFDLTYEGIWMYVQLIVADYQVVLLMLMAIIVAGALIRVFVSRRG